MQHARPLVLAALLACLPALGACNSGQPASDDIAGNVGASINKALDEAQAKLRNEPITVSHNDASLPKAEITPNGDFVVDGKTIAITPTQRSALLEYRGQMISVASEGIAIGKQGATLGLHAASTAIAAALSGKSDQEIQDKVKAQANQIRQAAVKICDRLPAMMTEQQKLATTLPAFKPYATMTEKDIDDCRTDALKDDDN